MSPSSHAATKRFFTSSRVTSATSGRRSSRHREHSFERRAARAHAHAWRRYTLEAVSVLARRCRSRSTRHLLMATILATEERHGFQFIRPALRGWAYSTVVVQDNDPFPAGFQIGPAGWGPRHCLREPALQRVSSSAHNYCEER